MAEVMTLVGNGNMALSIAQGLKERFALRILGRNPEHLARFEEKLGCPVEKGSIDNADITNSQLILCVKPANLSSVSELLKGKASVLFSVLAGTSLQALKQINANAYVRVMPNLAASKQLSMSALCGDESQRNRAEEIFSAIGYTQWLSSEKELDIATALSGSGPAYLSLFFEALCDGAVKQGLKRDDAMIFAKGLFSGFAALMQETHPALLKDAVMSPGGTTAAGYSALEKHGARHACIEAIEAAYKRAEALKG